MNKYYVIKNENGRYLKVRTGSNGSKREWVADMKGATVGTLLQCEAMKNELRKSPYFDGLEIVEIGEAGSAWQAKNAEDSRRGAGSGTRRTRNKMNGDVRIEFVVRKRPLGGVVKRLKDGTTVVQYQVTQEEMNDLIDKCI